MADYDHAYNHWRKTFEGMSNGYFTKTQFDNWFKKQANLSKGLPPADNIESHYDLGSKEHFLICLLRSFDNLIEASSAGSFGKRKREDD